ncbi:MAG TPA: hypothetical protein DIU07_14800 [Rhodobacteraceae bacterium]|nr:hypothetical protein [Paracoccaceae bacterium]
MADTWANPWTGEVALTIDGERRVLKLTLGVLAELEESLAEPSLVELVERFEQGRFSSRDVLALIVAGLRGGGWRGSSLDLMSAEIAGGPIEAAKVAGQLLVRAFSLPGDGTRAGAGAGGGR